jgi:hypothetical protein
MSESVKNSKTENYQERRKHLLPGGLTTALHPDKPSAEKQ